jgi:hypothetical protein
MGPWDYEAMTNWFDWATQPRFDPAPRSSRACSNNHREGVKFSVVSMRFQGPAAAVSLPRQVGRAARVLTEHSTSHNTPILPILVSPGQAAVGQKHGDVDSDNEAA